MDNTRTCFAALFAMLRTWHRRTRERREFRAMCVRDFGDLPVPPGRLRDESRRWPWQEPSPLWAEITPWRGRNSNRSANVTAPQPEAQPAVPVYCGDGMYAEPRSWILF